MDVRADFERRSGSWEGSSRVVIADRWRDWRTGSWSEWNEATIRFDVENFRFGRHAMEGAVNISWFDSDRRDGLDIMMEFGRDGRAQTIEVTGTITDWGDRFNIGRLNITYSETSIRRIDMPSWNEHHAIVVNGDDSAWRDMYDDITDARRDLRGNDMLDSVLQEIQWSMRYDWFWTWNPHDWDGGGWGW